MVRVDLKLVELPGESVLRHRLGVASPLGPRPPLYSGQLDDQFRRRDAILHGTSEYRIAVVIGFQVGRRKSSGCLAEAG